MSKIEGKFSTRQLLDQLGSIELNVRPSQERTYAKKKRKKKSVAKMCMLRWMCGNKTKNNRIRNECIWEHLGSRSIGDKLRDSF